MSSVYFAKWILMPDGRVLENGGVTVDGDTIVSVGGRSGLRRTSRDRIVNLGETLLLPGFINMHTHLEEGLLRGIPKEDTETFASWRAKRLSRMRNAPADAVISTVRLGILEALANGITTVVDFSRRDISPLVLRDEPIRSWVVHEIYAEDADAETEIHDHLEKRIRQSRHDSPNVGVGPHALYSLSPRSHRVISDFALQNRYLWASHMAESAEELQAFTEHGGDLYFQITRKKQWPFGDIKMTPMQSAISMNLIPFRGICIHCNYVSGQELSLLTAKHASVVACPRYTEEIGHKPFPLDIALQRGLNVCLGTESPGGSHAMNLFDELHYIKQTHPHLPALDLINLVTRNPAKALRSTGRLGSIDDGKTADIIGVRFNHCPTQNVLEEMLIEDPELAFVMVGGEEVIAGY